MLRSIFWEVKLDFFSIIRYRFGIISDIVIYSVLLLFFLNSGTGKTYGEIYHYENYKELLVVGYLAWFCAVTAITSVSQTVMGELKQGTFYRKLNSKYPLQILLMGKFLTALMVQSIIVPIILIFSACLGQVKLGLNMQIVIPVLISTSGMYGIGLAVAGLSVYYKRVGAITYIIQLGLLFVTDTIPSYKMLNKITGCLPLTVCNDIIRKEVTGIDCPEEYGRLIMLSAFFLILGMALFQQLLKKAKSKGNILFY